MANRRSVLVTAALSLSAVGVASGEQGISISPMHQDLGSWLFVPVMNGATVDSFVALKKDQSNADVTTVWFQHRVEGGWDKLACTNTNQEIAIDAIMYELELPHEQRRHWPPESQRFVMDGRSDNPIDDLIRRLPPDAARRVFNAVYDVEFVPSAISVFDDVDCEDHKILAWMSDTASNFHGLDGGVDSVTIDGTNALDACEYTMDLHPPVIMFTNMGDAPRVDSQGRKYYLESDNVIYTVEAHDWDRGVIPVELFVNGESFQQGQAIEDIGLKFIRAVVVDDFGDRHATMEVVNIRPRTDRYGYAYLMDRQVVYDRDQGAITRYTVNVTAGDFVPFDMRISTLYLTGIDQDQGSAVFSAYIKGMFLEDGSVDVANAEFGISEHDITAVFDVAGEIPEGTELNVFGVGATPGDDSEQFEIDLIVAEADPAKEPTPVHEKNGWEGNDQLIQECRPVEKISDDVQVRSMHLGVGYEHKICVDIEGAATLPAGRGARFAQQPAHADSFIGVHFGDWGMITGGSLANSSVANISSFINAPDYCWTMTQDANDVAYLKSVKKYVYRIPCPLTNCEKLTAFDATVSYRYVIKGEIDGLAMSAGAARLQIIHNSTPHESDKDDFKLSAYEGFTTSINVGLSWPPGQIGFGVNWEWKEQTFPPLEVHKEAKVEDTSHIVHTNTPQIYESIFIDTRGSIATLVKCSGTFLGTRREALSKSVITDCTHQVMDAFFTVDTIIDCVPDGLDYWP